MKKHPPKSLTALEGPKNDGKFGNSGGIPFKYDHVWYLFVKFLDVYTLLPKKKLPACFRIKKEKLLKQETHLLYFLILG